MTTITEYFEQAQLSLASYQSLVPGMSGATDAAYIAALTLDDQTAM